MKNMSNTTMNALVVGQRDDSALPVILGIDHGYGNIKTASCCFRTSVDQYKTHPELARHVLECNGRFYAIGEGHKEYRSDKMNDDDYYLLTLAAIARELNIRNVTDSALFIAAGLPLTWLGSQKETFRRYLLRNDRVSFRFDGKDYNVSFTGADIFPQGFAAVADKLHQFRGQNMIADIGNGTMNIMFVNDRRPVAKQCFTESCGVNQCLLAVREQITRVYGQLLDEQIVEQVLRTGTADISKRCLDIIWETATQYTAGIVRVLRERGYNPDFMRLYVVGGGGCLLENFGKYDTERVTICRDIHANAKGYEYLARLKLRRGR